MTASPSRMMAPQLNPTKQASWRQHHGEWPGEPRAVVTHSTRSFPLTSRRATEEACDSSVPETEPTAEADDPAERDEGEEPTGTFLTEEDLANFEQLPPAPTPQECRLLWTGLLEIQDEVAMQTDTAAALANNTVTMPTRVTLAARHLCRIRRLLHGRSTVGLLRLATALPGVLNGIQETVADEIEHVLRNRQVNQGTKRARTEGEADDRRAGEEEEEEVPIEEDGELPPQDDETALMQSPSRLETSRPTPKEEAWRALTVRERQTLASTVRSLLGVQSNAEPSLVALAYVDTPPALAGCGLSPEEERQYGVSLSEMRPSILRWLWTTPREHVAGAVEAVLGVPGRTHPEPATMQAIARQLQMEVGEPSNPILEQVLRSWSDSADISIVEELLKMALEGAHQKAIQRAITRLRGTRRQSVAAGSDRRQQLTLQRAWSPCPRKRPTARTGCNNMRTRTH